MLPPQLVCWHMATQLSLLAFRVGIISLKYFRGILLFQYFGFIKVSAAEAIELQERGSLTGVPAQSTQLLLMSAFQDFYHHWGDLWS